MLSASSWTQYPADVGFKLRECEVRLTREIFSVADGRRRVGISTATLLRWQKKPEFQKAYREARRAAHSQSIARLQQATGAAVSTLLKVMLDPNTPASVKVRASDSVLDHSAKSIELEDIEARLVELERNAEASNGG
jgi:hypothetical protein